MPFTAGDAVHVRLLGKGVVREARNGRRYLVEIKGASLIVAEDQLTAFVEGKAARRSPAGPAASAPVEPPALSARVPAIDLHGMTTAEAVEAVDRFINDALLEGAAEARIIHGRSGGRLKSAVHARLKQLPSVRDHRLDPGNAGVTMVSL